MIFLTHSRVIVCGRSTYQHLMKTILTYGWKLSSAKYLTPQLQASNRENSRIMSKISKMLHLFSFGFVIKQEKVVFRPVTVRIAG